MSEESNRPKPSDFGASENAPPVEEKPYETIFEANKCFEAGRCAEIADNQEMGLETSLTRARSYLVGEDELDENVEAAGICPTKKGRDVAHVTDRRTDEELLPDPHGDGTFSIGW